MCNTTENAFCITFSLRCFSIDWPCLWCKFILAQPMDLSIEYSFSIFHLNFHNPSYFLTSEFKSRIRSNEPIQNMNFFQRKFFKSVFFLFNSIISNHLCKSQPIQMKKFIGYETKFSKVKQKWLWITLMLTHIFQKWWKNSGGIFVNYILFISDSQNMYTVTQTFSLTWRLYFKTTIQKQQSNWIFNIQYGASTVSNKEITGQKTDTTMNNWISEKEQKNCLRMKCHASSTLRMALELWIASILRAKNAEACEFQMMKFMTEIQEFKALYADKVAIEMESKWKWKCVCERKNNELMTMEKMIVYIPSFHLLRRPVTKSPWLCSCADNQTKHKTKYQRNQHSRCEGGKTIFLSIFWYHYCAPINSEKRKETNVRQEMKHPYEQKKKKSNKMEKKSSAKRGIQVCDWMWNSLGRHTYEQMKRFSARTLSASEWMSRMQILEIEKCFK